jgi:hypothetical protein
MGNTKKICFILNLIGILFIGMNTCHSAQEDEKRAIDHITRGISQEFQLESKFKMVQVSATNYIKHNISEAAAEVPAFIIGSGSQIIIQKKISFRGKTPILGNRYELLLKRSVFQLKLEGKNPFMDDSKYWILGNNDRTAQSSLGVQLGLAFYF